MNIEVTYSINLDPEQKEKYIEFINAFRGVIGDKKHRFNARHIANELTVIKHSSKPDYVFQLFTIDFEAIWKANLFDGGYLNDIHEMDFVINQFCIEYYNFLVMEKQEPIRFIEKTYFDYLLTDNFKKRYPKSFSRWITANNLFFSKEADKNYTSIGHFCREAIQEFSDEVNNNLGLDLSAFQKREDKNKIKNVLNHRKSYLGDTHTALIDSLIDFWNKLSSSIQRQEHNTQNSNVVLTYEDTRRVLFFTAIVMYEVDKISS